MYSILSLIAFLKSPLFPFNRKYSLFHSIHSSYRQLIIICPFPVVHYCFTICSPFLQWPLAHQELTAPTVQPVLWAQLASQAPWALSLLCLDPRVPPPSKAAMRWANLSSMRMAKGAGKQTQPEDGAWCFCFKGYHSTSRWRSKPSSDMERLD